MTFKQKLAGTIDQNKSLVCVGLDLERSKLPAILSKKKDPLFEFNKTIIDATLDLVCCYKPNSAFYEAEGVAGLELLQRTIAYINGRVPVILDVKRGDIGNTAKAYAKAAFEDLKADAVTLSPYMGFDSVEPFIAYKAKAAFVLCLTSNPGSIDFQKPELFKSVAQKVTEWDKKYGNLGLVVGATNAQDIQEVRTHAPGLPFLVPGVGAQGGSVQDVLNYGVRSKQDQVIINSSRAILYASTDADFGTAARRATLQLRDEINSFRK